jgi:predicted nucleic acid-binding protein
VFVDTNVIVYADDARDGTKRARAIDVLASAIADERAVISTQILQEYYAVATRKLGLSTEDARARVEMLSKLEVVQITPALILGAIDLQRAHAVSFWDALVVKCATEADCDAILSEDLHHGQTIDGVRIVNPFDAKTRAGERRSRYAPTRAHAR